MEFYKCCENGLLIPVCQCHLEESALQNASKIVPNTVDAAKEKHLPVVTVSDNIVTVCIGSVLHPMEEKHSITTVILETNYGGQYHYLKPSLEPKAQFALAKGEQPIAAYAYCNLHGLWKVEIS